MVTTTAMTIAVTIAAMTAMTIVMTTSGAAFTPPANSASATAPKPPARTCGATSHSILTHAGTIMPTTATATTSATDTNIASTTLPHIVQVTRAFIAQTDTGTGTTGKRQGASRLRKRAAFVLWALFWRERFFDGDLFPLLNFDYAVQAAVAGHSDVNNVSSRI